MTREQAKAICRSRALSGEPFTAADLTGHLIDENAGRYTVDGTECFRIADGVIQSLRRNGTIAFTRSGNTITWSLVSGNAA